MQNILKTTLTITTALSMTLLTSCGTLTGIPAHGGGKRFSVEQRLVSASIRATLMDIDVSALRGQRVAIVYDLISDEGGGNISGGRLNLMGQASLGTMVSPVVSGSSQFQVFDLVNTSSAFTNVSTGSTQNTMAVTSAISTGLQTGVSNTNGTSTGTSTNNGSSSSNENGTSTSSSTGNSTREGSGTSQNNSTGSNTGTSGSTGQTSTNSTSQNDSTSTNSGSSNSTSSGTSGGTSTNTGNSTDNVNTTTTTGGTTTTQVGSNTGTSGSTSNSTGQNTGTSSSTSTGSGSGSNTGSSSTTGTQTGSGTSTSNSTGSSTGSSTSASETNSTASGTGSSTNATTGTSTSTTNASGTNSETRNSSTESEGTENRNTNSDVVGTEESDSVENTTTNHQALSDASSTTRKEKGSYRDAKATLQYRGLGDYQVLGIPKSDASLLMGLVRNYLILNGVEVTVPSDRSATALVYVTVDVFGINRSRFDAYVYNRENVKAETGIEMFAFGRDGSMLMRPTSSNYLAAYDEKYLFWAGPFKSDQEVRKGEGLLVTFEDVDGTKNRYNSTTSRTRNFDEKDHTVNEVK